jgi:hypothetical protein
MTLSYNLRRTLAGKAMQMCAPLPVPTTLNGFIVDNPFQNFPFSDTTYYFASATQVYEYDTQQDSWQQIPSPSTGGSFGVGSCGAFHCLCTAGGVQFQTATGGSTTTINTSLNITRDLSGAVVMVNSGPGAGYIGKILSNTKGANAILTLATPSGTAFTSATTFRMFTGSVYFFSANSAGASAFSVYDRATNTWTTLNVTNLPTTWTTGGAMFATSSYYQNNGVPFDSGTVTSATTNSITDSTKNWVGGNNWMQHQIRITSGTAAGQVYPNYTGSTTSSTTVNGTFSTTPDTTSTYVIEGADDEIWLFGGASGLLYDFSFINASWAQDGGTSRTVAATAGTTIDWGHALNGPEIYQSGNNYTLTTIWEQSNFLYNQQGRYFWSFRGNGTSSLDVFDNSFSTWYMGVPYAGQAETFNTGSCSCSDGNYIYIQKEATGRIFRFDIEKRSLSPWAVNRIPQGTGRNGKLMFIGSLTEGSTTQKFIYTLSHSRQELVRFRID